MFDQTRYPTTATRWLLIGVIAVLQVGDVLSTNLALSTNGVAEINPVMAWGQAHLTYWWTLKIAIIPPLVVCLLRMPTSRPAAITASIFFAVICNNLLWAL